MAILESGNRAGDRSTSTLIGSKELHYNWIDTYVGKAIFWDRLKLDLYTDRGGALVMNLAEDSFEPLPGERGLSVLAEGWEPAGVIEHPELGSISGMDPNRYRYVNAIGTDDAEMPELFVDSTSGQGAITLDGGPHVIEKTFWIPPLAPHPDGYILYASIMQCFNSEGLGVDVALETSITGESHPGAGVYSSSVDNMNTWTEHGRGFSLSPSVEPRLVTVRLVQTTIPAPPPTTPLLGDMDLDTDVDFDDIDDLVLGLTNPPAYEAEYGVPPSFAGDTDCDMDLDLDDIDGIVAILAGGDAESCLPVAPSTLALEPGAARALDSRTLAAVPEPSTLALGVMGLLTFAQRRRENRRRGF